MIRLSIYDEGRNYNNVKCMGHLAKVINGLYK